MKDNMRLRGKTTVTIPYKQFAKMFLYAKHCTTEIGGLIVGRINDNEINIEEIVLVEQRATHGDVELEDEAISKYLSKNPEKTIVGWWHSHANMSVFFSGTDDSTSKKFAEIGYCLSIVVNKRGEYKAAIYHKAAKFNMFFIEEVELQVTFDDGLEDQIKKEIQDKVKSAWYDRHDRDIKYHDYDDPFSPMWGSRWRRRK